jgi:hypothetical protein
VKQVKKAALVCFIVLVLTVVAATIAFQAYSETWRLQATNYAKEKIAVNFNFDTIDVIWSMRYGLKVQLTDVSSKNLAKIDFSAKTVVLYFDLIKTITKQQISLAKVNVKNVVVNTSVNFDELLRTNSDDLEFDLRKLPNITASDIKLHIDDKYHINVDRLYIKNKAFTNKMEMLLFNDADDIAVTIGYRKLMENSRYSIVFNSKQVKLSNWIASDGLPHNTIFILKNTNGKLELKKSGLEDIQFNSALYGKLSNELILQNSVIKFKLTSNGDVSLRLKNLILAIPDYYSKDLMVKKIAIKGNLAGKKLKINSLKMVTDNYVYPSFIGNITCNSILDFNCNIDLRSDNNRVPAKLAINWIPDHKMSKLQRWLADSIQNGYFTDIHFGWDPEKGATIKCICKF